jgi:hypothetical protein
MKRIKTAGAFLLFAVLATANSGGYRYGVGDQAFYQPATELRLHPELFPRDGSLIESQAKLTIVDETLAAASRVTHLDLPKLFLILYVASLALMFAASNQLARVMGLSPAASMLFMTLLTLRHRIAKTGANTLEGYMHPRQLAFALGVFAFTASLRRRWLPLTLLWLVAAVIHPTTAFWWAVAIAAQLVITTSGRQRLLMGVTLIVLVAGSFAARSVGFAVMDDQWVRVLDNKDYLFASGWPVYAWVFNLAYLPLILLISKWKNDSRLVAPSLALFAAFVCSYPFTEAHVALAVQLQVSRVFWLLDFFLALFGAWLLVDRIALARPKWMPQAMLAAAAILSVGRGVYTVREAGPARAFVQVDLHDDDWTEAMRWIGRQPGNPLVLANPDHAWLYGTSVRVAASRDVVVESVKDSAISMYDRDVAMRTAERLSALAAYDKLTADQAVALGRRFGATVMVTDTTHPLSLPELHRNASFVVYEVQ